MTHGLLRTANVGKRGLRWKFRRAEGENSMSESMYPPASLDLARKRRDLAPLIRDAFHAFSQLVFAEDRKSTRLNSSHGYISYAVFCLKKKKTQKDFACHSRASPAHVPEPTRSTPAHFTPLASC